MDLIAYLDVFRRRWVLIVACGALAVVAILVTMPSQQEVIKSRTSYRATATLIGQGGPDNLMSPEVMALYTTIGKVPELVKKKLHAKESPQTLASMVTTEPRPDTGTLTISSVDSDRSAAQNRANAFADELVLYLQQRNRDKAQQEIDNLDKVLSQYSKRLDEVSQELIQHPDRGQLIAEREGIQASYQSAVGQKSGLEGTLVQPSPLTVIQPAVSIPETTSGGIGPPTSPTIKLLIGAALGIALGMALALVMERLDSRLRTREQVEQAFGVPVLSEIPGRPWDEHDEHVVLSAEEPDGATAEAYRALRSAVLLMAPSGRTSSSGQQYPGRRHPEVIMVTSAHPGEGKTSTAVNLAVVMAESGRRVLILSLDFRDPTVDGYLDVAAAAGVSDLLGANRPQELENVVHPTPYPNVQIVAAGSETAHPGALLAGAGPLIRKARKLADVVIIDTAPLLAVSDAVDISQHVDAALIVVRSNRATVEHGRSAHRLLSRMGVPALGAVLVGGTRSSAFDSYQLRPVRGDEADENTPDAKPAPPTPLRPSNRDRRTGTEGEH